MPRLSSVVASLSLMLSVVFLGVEGANCLFSQCECDEELGVVDCSRRNLSAIPDFYTLSNAEKYFKLNLSSNAISELSAYAFVPLRFQSIEILNNPLQEIDQQAFTGLEVSLQQLSIGSSKTQTPTLGEGSLQFLLKLVSLKELRLQGFSLTSLTGKYWQHLPLQEVALQSSKVVGIQPTAFNGLASTLTDLSIEHDRYFFNVPAQRFSQLVSLKRISFKNCSIKSIATNVFPESVEAINLSSNNISTLIAGSFANLTNLKSLDLSENNQLGKFEKNLVAFSQSMPSLTFLNLANCGISNIEPVDFLVKAPRLESLKLDDNHLQRLPFNYQNSAFSQDDIPFRYLVRLGLRRNNITDFGRDSLTGLPSLSYVDLSENTMNFLQQGDLNLNALSSMVQVDLRNNSIMGIDPLASNQWHLLQEVNLEGNPLICDCSALFWIAFNEPAKSAINGQCEQPEDLRGESLSSVFDGIFHSKCAFMFEVAMTWPVILGIVLAVLILLILLALVCFFLFRTMRRRQKEHLAATIPAAAYDTKSFHKTNKRLSISRTPVTTAATSLADISVPMHADTAEPIYEPAYEEIPGNIQSEQQRRMPPPLPQRSGAVSTDV